MGAEEGTFEQKNKNEAPKEIDFSKAPSRIEAPVNYKTMKDFPAYKKYFQEEWKTDKDKRMLTDQEIDRIKLVNASNLPGEYKEQFKSMNDPRLGDVMIAIVPADLWKRRGKSQPSESEASRDLVLFDESYFNKGDKVSWMSHELGHCLYWKNNPLPAEYQKDSITFSYKDIKSKEPYPNNKVEHMAFQKQFEYLKQNGKTKQEISKMMEELKDPKGTPEYSAEDMKFFNKLLDDIFKP